MVGKSSLAYSKYQFIVRNPFYVCFSGVISVTELKKAFKKMNVDVTDSEINYLLKW